MSQPWERQEGESDKAFAAFCAYRDMGPGRSMEVLAGRGKSVERARIPGHWARWSIQFKWTDRAAAYDSHIDSARLASVLEAQGQEAVQQHLARLAAFARKAIEVGTEALELAQRSIQAAKGLPPEAVTPQEAQGLIRAAVTASQFGFDAEAVALGVRSAIEGERA